MAGFAYFSGSGIGTTEVLQQAFRAIAPGDFQGAEGRWEGPSGCAVWRYGHNAPYDRFDGDRGTTVVFGDAIAESEDRYLDARMVHEKIVEADTQTLSRYSGLYAWLFLGNDGSFVVGADPFGLFPIYYFHEGDAFGVSTSLSAFRKHPAYDDFVDLVGVCRYLIENGSVGVRTVESSGRRLDFGTVLRFDSVRNTCLLQTHSIPKPQPEPKILDSEIAVECCLSETRRATQRLMARPPDHCMLSGGLDSRQVLALALEAGIRPIACTAGRSSDYEAIFARAVAKRLHVPWRCRDDSVNRIETDIRNELALFSLGGGFSTWTMNGESLLSRSVGTRALSGIILDAHHVPYFRDKSPHPKESYEYAFEKWVNCFGVDPQTMTALCGRGPMRDAYATALDEIRRDWESIPLDGFDRLWWTLMRCRARPHLGSKIWRDSFYAWPVVPGLDLRLAERLRGVSHDFFRQRWLQSESLRRMAPGMCEIPLATICHSPKALAPTVAWNVRRKLLRARANLMPRRRRESLHRYTRALHLNHPTWRKVRDMADPQRGRLEPYFEMDAVAAYLPSPGSSARDAGVPAHAHAGCRILYGFMLWLEGGEEST